MIKIITTTTIIIIIIIIIKIIISFEITAIVDTYNFCYRNDYCITRLICGFFEAH